MRMLLPAVLVVIALLVFLWAMQRRLMYFPLGAVLEPAEAGATHVERLTFPTSDGLTLHGWFFPAPAPVSTSAPASAATSASTSGTAPPSPSRFTIVVFNGNAGNRSYRAPLASALQARGHAVLLFDYRGYGGNPGSPTESGLTEDARAARAYVVGRPGVDRERVAYFGESLGTGVAVTLAAEHPPAALVLRSPFTSMVDVGRMHYPIFPVRSLLRDRYDSSGRIARIASPLLVIAGDRDSVIPVEQSRQLYDAAASASRKELLIVRGADHNDASLLDGDEMIAAVDAFLQRR
jgi:fermentation-respiration switch protein FrsA (DUF1100 family)